MNAVDQLYSRLLRRIQLSELGWREGDIIPTEIELARAERVSRTTVRAVLKRLTALGRLATASGKRRQVSRPPAVVPQFERQPIEKELGRLAKTLRAPTTRTIKQLCGRSPVLLEQLREGNLATTSWGEALLDIGQRPTDVALKPTTPVPLYTVASDAHFDLTDVLKSLGLDASASVYWLLRIRCANDVPVALQWCVVPVRPWGNRDLNVTNDDLIPGGLTRRYREFGIRRDFATLSLRAHRAAAEEAQFLKVDLDAALIEERRVSYMLRRSGSAEQLWPYEYLLTLYSERIRLHSAWSEIDEKRSRDSG